MSFLCVVLDARRNQKEKNRRINLFSWVYVFARELMSVERQPKTSLNEPEVGRAYKLNPRKRSSTNFI